MDNAVVLLPAPANPFLSNPTKETHNNDSGLDENRAEDLDLESEREQIPMQSRSTNGMDRQSTG